MPIPANLTTVTVTGTYSNVNGVSRAGTVTFIPTRWLRDTDSDTVIPVLPHTATLTSGSFSASLVATDNEDIDQVWAYRVVETIDGAVNTFTALLPASLVSVSMADLVPVTSDPEYFSLQGPRGEQGEWDSAQTINAKTDNYILLTADAGDLVTVDASGNVDITVDGSLNLSAGQRIDLLRLGTGEVTVVASVATVNGTPGLKLRAQYSAATLLCVAADSYVLLGDLKA